MTDLPAGRQRRSPKAPVVRQGAAVGWATLDALRDGEWHSYHDVFTRVAWTIPAGDALAERERLRVREWERRYERKGLPIPEEGPPPRSRNNEPSTELLRARKTVFMRRVVALRGAGFLIYHPEVGKDRLLITEKGKRHIDAYHAAREATA